MPRRTAQGSEWDRGERTGIDQVGRCGRDRQGGGG